MKAGIFSLTKNEQRVVVLVIVALLTGAFVRYWRDMKAHPATNPSAVPETSATPILLQEELIEQNADRHPASPKPSP